MLDLPPLGPRPEPKRLGRFHRGAHKPLAIRWFGMTALASHLRHLLAVAAASNHDWYDGLDGFGRLFRRSALKDFAEPMTERGGSAATYGDSFSERAEGALQRILRLDEFDESLRLVEEAAESLAAILLRSTPRRPSRLALAGYTAAQEASYWALALAPG